MTVPPSIRRSVLATVCFFAGLLLLDRVVGAGFSGLLPQMRTGVVGLPNQAVANRDADIILFGSSRTRHHLMPAVVGERSGRTVFNAGANGQGMFYHCLRQGLLLDQGSTAKLFILLADPEVLTDDTFPRAFRMNVFADQSPRVRALMADVMPHALLKSLSRVADYNGSALPILFSYSFASRAETDGFVPLVGSLLPTRPVFSPNHKAHSTSPRTVERNLALLRIFLDVARENGVKVVAVTSPYLMRDSDSQQAQRLQGQMSDLLRTEGVPYLAIDEREYPEFRERRLYYDNAHLNADGALAYSRALAQKLVAQGLLP